MILTSERISSNYIMFHETNNFFICRLYTITNGWRIISCIKHMYVSFNNFYGCSLYWMLEFFEIYNHNETHKHNLLKLSKLPFLPKIIYLKLCCFHFAQYSERSSEQNCSIVNSWMCNWIICSIANLVTNLTVPFSYVSFFFEKLHLHTREFI